MPILTLIGIAVGGLIFNFRATGTVSVPINEAFVLCVLSAMVLALIKGMRLTEVIEGFVDGVKGVSLGAIILALAVVAILFTAPLGLFSIRYLGPRLLGLDPEETV